jgi:hypothetical protein
MSVAGDAGPAFNCSQIELHRNNKLHFVHSAIKIREKKMNAVSIVIILFIVLESMNVIVLYFFPGSRKGNGVGIFKAYEKSKNYPDLHAFIKYLIHWVAGTKLIFILLLAGNNIRFHKRYSRFNIK